MQMTEEKFQYKTDDIVLALGNNVVHMLNGSIAMKMNCCWSSEIRKFDKIMKKYVAYGTATHLSDLSTPKKEKSFNIRAHIYIFINVIQKRNLDIIFLFLMNRFHFSSHIMPKMRRRNSI